MSGTFLPTDLSLTHDSQLRIEWSDGKTMLYPIAKLRAACPCATCREKNTDDEKPKKKMAILSASEAAPLRIASMRPVGNYAYQISFSDDHSSGIFTLELLRSIGIESVNGANAT